MLAKVWMAHNHTPDASRSTLAVRKLPDFVDEEAAIELFARYGAVEVKYLKGKMRGKAFVRFETHEDAAQALPRLRSLNLNGHQLKVDWAKPPPSEAKQPNNAVTNSSTNAEPIQTASPKSNTNRPAVDPIAPALGFDYPANPDLYYDYPPLNPTILTNITNAIIAVPRLYIQVLHLMNKMNIPPPFGAPRPTPPLKTYKPHKRKRDDELLSSSESELESEEEEDEPSAKRRKLISVDAHTLEKLAGELGSTDTQPPRKVPSMTPPQPPPPPLPGYAPMTASYYGTAYGPPAVSPLRPSPPLPPRLQIQLSTTSLPDTAQIPNVPLVSPPPPPQPAQSHPLSTAVAEPTAISLPSGIYQRPGVVKYSELVAKRVPKEKLLEDFPSYAEGEPHSKLYIKNLSKHVASEDLFALFAMFFESDERARNELNIRLMQEGRMKGQAFVTFPSVELATRALRETHGFELKGKPMIIQFGRK